LSRYRSSFLDALPVPFSSAGKFLHHQHKGLLLQ
jgi:hypothetical protein